MDWASRIFWTTSIQRSSMPIREKSRMLYMRAYHNRLCRFLEWNWLPHQLFLLNLGISRSHMLYQGQKPIQSWKQFYFRIKSRYGAIVAVVALAGKAICDPPSLDNQSRDVRRWDYEQIQTRKAWQTFLIAWDDYCGRDSDSHQSGIYYPKRS